MPLTCLLPSPRARRAGSAAALAALLLSPAAASGSAACPGADTSLPAGDAAAARAALDCLIDHERTRRGLRPLRSDADLAEAAARHATDMVRRGYFSHVSRSGSTVSDRVRRTGYLTRAKSWHVGEVLAWGTGSLSTPAATVEAWLASPGHRDVLLERDYEEAGIGLERGSPHDPTAAGATFTIVVGEVTR